MAKTISQLILEYFSNHPNQNLKHGVVVDWVTEQWLKDHKTPPRDPWRAIRQLHQGGKLVKVKKGVYRYQANYVHEVELWDFPESTKKAILERDNYHCVVCGRGEEHGVELVIDHTKPKDKGGTNDIENGQTLCMEHNLLKKNYSQTEAGKRYFIKMYETAVSNNDTRLIEFCKSVFDAYNEFKINAHIPRPNRKNPTN